MSSAKDIRQPRLSTYVDASQLGDDHLETVGAVVFNHRHDPAGLFLEDVQVEEIWLRLHALEEISTHLLVLLLGARRAAVDVGVH